MVNLPSEYFILWDNHRKMNALQPAGKIISLSCSTIFRRQFHVSHFLRRLFGMTPENSHTHACMYARIYTTLNGLRVLLVIFIQMHHLTVQSNRLKTSPMQAIPQVLPSSISQCTRHADTIQPVSSRDTCVSNMRAGIQQHPVSAQHRILTSGGTTSGGTIFSMRSTWLKFGSFASPSSLARPG